MIKRLGKLSRFFLTSEALAKKAQPQYGELHTELYIPSLSRYVEVCRILAHRACRDEHPIPISLHTFPILS
jgi:hypothetical protein